jgi:hypothetical protein
MNLFFLPGSSNSNEGQPNLSPEVSQPSDRHLTGGEVLFSVGMGALTGVAATVFREGVHTPVDVQIIGGGLLVVADLMAGLTVEHRTQPGGEPHSLT